MFNIKLLYTICFIASCIFFFMPSHAHAQAGIWQGSPTLPDSWCPTEPAGDNCAAMGYNLSGACTVGQGCSIKQSGLCQAWGCVANPNPPAMDGVCRSYTGTYTSQPATNFSTGCSVGGGYVDRPDTSNTWQWQCNGDGAGVAVQCSADKDLSGSVSGSGGVPGLCGSSNGQEYGTAPTSARTMCARGVPSSATLSSGSWRWTCVGSDGSPPVSCSALSCASPPIHGACGVNHGQTLSSAPSGSSLCANGSTPTAVSGTGPWTWGCNGANGGTSTAANACRANRAVTGLLQCCKGKGNDPDSSRFLCNNASHFCDPGNSVYETSGNCFWGDVNSCRAATGSCGTAHTGNYTNLTTTSPGLCASGYVRNFGETAGGWTWVCNDEYLTASSGPHGNGPMTVPVTGPNCSATRDNGSGVCSVPLGGNSPDGLSQSAIIAGCLNGYSQSEYGPTYVLYDNTNPFSPHIVCHNNQLIPTNMCSGGTAGQASWNGNPMCNGAFPQCVSPTGTWTQIGIETCGFQVPALELPTHCESRVGFMPGGACDPVAEAVDGSCNHGEYAGGGSPYGSCGSSQRRQRTYECQP